MAERLEPAPEPWVEAAKMLPRIHAGDEAVIDRAQRDPEFRKSAIMATQKAIASAESGDKRESLQEMLLRLEAL